MLLYIFYCEKYFPFITINVPIIDSLRFIFNRIINKTFLIFNEIRNVYRNCVYIGARPIGGCVLRVENAVKPEDAFLMTL